MGFGESMKSFYEGLEDRYYSFLDSLEGKGIHVYKVVDAIEASNIPSFPLVIILSLIMLGLIGWVIFGMFFASANLVVSVEDSLGTPIGGAIITVYDGSTEIFSGTTGSDGTATTGIPRGKEVKVTAQKTGYRESTQPFTGKEDEATLTFRLSREITTIKKTLQFLSAGTTRLYNSEIEAEFSCTGNNYTTVKNTLTGIIDVEVPSDCDTLNVRMLNDAVLQKNSIYLSSDTQFQLFVEETGQAKGSALVTIRSENNENIAGIDVSLYTVTSTGAAGTALQTVQSAANGTASFGSVPVGKYYVVTFDRTGSYAEYIGLGSGNVQEVREGSITTFSVVLSENVSGKIKLLLKDKATSEPVEGALVTLSKGQTQIKSLYSDAQGKVEFPVAENAQYSLTIDKAGYLIANVSASPSADYKQVFIEMATIQNSQSLLVTVLDEIGKPVENVRLKLKNNADGAQVGKELVTGLDGKAIFERVEDGSYYVNAIKPGYGEQTSSPIQLDSRQENVLEMRLPIGFGKIRATVLDEQGNPVTDALIRVVDLSTGEVILEENADSDGKKEVEARADKKVFLVVASGDFLNAITSSIKLQKDVTLEKTIVLSKSVQGFGVEFEGLFLNNEQVSEVQTTLSAGQIYTAKLRLLVPQNSSFEEAGVHLRTGKEENDAIEKDFLYITEVRSSAKNVQKGTSYTPPQGQGTDYQHLTSGNAKWANIVFQNINAGIYEIEADIQVREEARIGSALDVFYRAWAKSGGYMRVPNDAVLGASNSSGEKEALYANALKRVYSVGPSSMCGEEFCSTYSITDLRESLTSNIIEEYTAQITNNYRLDFELSSVSDTPLTNAQFSFKDKTSAVNIKSYRFTNANGQILEAQNTGSEFTVQAGNISKDSVIKGEIVFETRKEGTSPLQLSVLAGSTNNIEVYRKTINVKIEPADKMNIDILPKVIVPLINNNMLVRVTDEDGAALPNTVVSIIKGDAVIASGETDGDGIFAYTILSPGDGEKIGVLAQKTGYLSTQKELTVSSNILLTEPKAIKLSVNAGDNDFKTIDALILNYTQIPLDIEKAEVTKEFDGFARIELHQPEAGTTIPADSNSELSGTLRLGPEGILIGEPTKINGAINIYLSNPIFKQTWVASIPLELNIGFGNEVDSTDCFSVFPGEWKITGSPNNAATLQVSVSNNCMLEKSGVPLRNLSARIVTGTNNSAGKFTAKSSLDGSRPINLDASFRQIGELLPQNADETINLEFQPSDLVSASGEAKIEFRAIHLTSFGEQEFTQKIDVLINLNNLNECVEILTDRDIVVNSCPYNTGYGNYSGQFSNYSNSRYSAYDPYSTQYGYGTGLPSYIGSTTQNSIYGDSYYDYAGATYPNAGYNTPYYTGTALGTGAYSPAMNMAWNCGEGGFTVRNNCAAPIELSFDSQAGITTAEQTTDIEAGEETTIKIQPTNFFGRYALDVKAKPKGSTEKAIALKTVYVNVLNEATKNYRDCISVSATTLNFNNFFGKPVKLDVINSCYNEGVFLEYNNGTISFNGLGLNTPTDASANYQSQQAGMPTNPEGAGFREMIESYAAIDERFATSPNGKVTQIVSFELVKALKQYQNSAPEATFFEDNQFANIGNLRYFLSSGYYSVMGRASMNVWFTAPYGGKRSTSFQMTLKDYWPLLNYADKLRGQLTTFGDSSLKAKDCINEEALNWAKNGVYLPIGEFRTYENGVLFIISDKGGCGFADYLDGVNPMQIPDPNTGLILIIEYDKFDEIKKGTHELKIRFDETHWNHKRATFTFNASGKVTRISPAGTDLVGLPIKINIEGSETPGGQGVPSEGTVYTCTDGGTGKTGTGAFEKYGLQHINYEYRPILVTNQFCDVKEYDASTSSFKDRGLTDPNKSYTTSSWKGPYFCDAVQTLLTFTNSTDGKITEIQKVTNALGDNIGTCTRIETSYGFDCGDAENKTSENLFRYVISQSEGYFLNKGKVVDLTQELSQKLKGEIAGIEFGSVEETLNAIPDSDNDGKITDIDIMAWALNDSGKQDLFIQKITSTRALMQKMNDALTKEGLRGAEIVLEINNWNAKTTGVNIDDFGGVKLSNDSAYYVIPMNVLIDELTDLEDYEEWHNKAQAKMVASTKDCTGTNCQISGAKQDSAERTLKAVFIYQLFVQGNWKITARNYEAISKEVKDLIMQKGEWKPAPQTGYKNLYQFYYKNVEPNMYLIKDNYNGAWAKFNNSYTTQASKFGEVTFTEPTNIEPGDHHVLVKYYWAGTNTNNTTKVTLGNPERTLINIDAQNNNTTTYNTNYLFSMPVDGDVTGLGTAFKGLGIEQLYFNYYGINQPDNRAFIQATKATGMETKNYTQSTTYNSIKTGKIVEFKTDIANHTPSEPVLLEMSFNKSNPKTSAGLLFKLIQTEATINSGLAWTSTTNNLGFSDKQEINPMQYNGNALCNTLTETYEGIIVSNDKTGAALFKSLIFVPPHFAQNLSLYVACIKDSGSMKATNKLVTSGSTPEISSQGALSLSLSTGNDYQKNLNIQSLISMVKGDNGAEGKVCVEAHTSDIAFSWNSKLLSAN